MVRYRPQKSLLSDAMKEAKNFNSIDEMYEYIVREWNHLPFEVMTINDLSIGEIIGNDDRVDWKNCRYVCTKRIGNEIYKTPQCIGICCIEELV